MKNRIMIYGPKDDGTYVVEFKTAGGETTPRLYNYWWQLHGNTLHSMSVSSQ
jgi:hypothetical protein